MIHYLYPKPEVLKCQIYQFLMSNIFILTLDRFDMFCRYLCLEINFIINKSPVQIVNYWLILLVKKLLILTWAFLVITDNLSVERRKFNLLFLQELNVWNLGCHLSKFQPDRVNYIKFHLFWLWLYFNIL